MHEASLMRGLMRRIESVAAAEGARRVVRVAVRLGALSHFSPEHFREHFVQAAAGTIARDAKVDISVSRDTRDPTAQDVVLEDIEIET
ncbi:MAG: hydrogenase maturation nickel metallochaperone HypA [Alphaproteobacteria bacterium]|nr:hydrogenase maturation nickel metallochaperone HypA [Alphaproteobacteria bacterium]